MKFRSSTDGFITGVKFYKGPQNTGSHTGTLWSHTGTQLASVVFNNESASGWQEAAFATPVAVTANTTYVISYHAPNGKYSSTANYFTQSYSNGPLTALQDGTDGSNGVYKYGSAVAFPTDSYQSTNYWVDAVFSDSATPPADTTAPTITSTSPANNATQVATSAQYIATFSEALNASTVTSASATLSTGGNTVSAAVSYDAAAKTIKLTPASALTTNTTYTVTFRGGTTDPRIKDVAGNALASNQTFSFTTTTNPGAPATESSLWYPASQSVSVANDDTDNVELGTRFTSNIPGTITSIAFYKGSSDPATTHTVKLWDSNGTQIGSGTTSNETSSGWQTAVLSTPVVIAANTTYTASYVAPNGRYSVSTGNLNTAFTNSPLTALASGGVYKYGGGYPASTWGNSNYWIDVIFSDSITPPADTTAPQVSSVTPANNATNIAVGTNVTATFNEPLTASTLSSSSFTLQTSAGTAVPGAVSYNTANNTATLDPTANLTDNTTYVATLTTAVKDATGNPLATSYTWSFTTPAPTPVSDLTKGPGGPILVLQNPDLPFSGYASEILRAEGLNSFATASITTVTASTLSSYDVIVLGDISLTAAQVTLLTNWVNDGGNLIAFSPDKQLAGLLGLTDLGTTLPEGYIGVDTSAEPGAGIVGQTIQYHGSADRYSLNAGTRAIAMLYSNATTATSSPAVSIRSVGSNGGQAVAFTYDLASSIVWTHQGNPAWAGEDRDGTTPVRTNDLFFGNKTGDVEPDYIDLNKVAIPQADEQQRLLANIINYTNQDNTPLPKFWYFPNDKKAVMVMAGDDHSTSAGTKDSFNYLLAQQPANCNVANWECFRATSYIYESSPLTNSEAAAFNNQGFDIGSHISTGCADFTAASLDAAFTSELSAFRAKYTGLPNQTGSRTHCIVWSDYDSTPKVEAEHGIRIDLNYYYWPASWLNNRPGYMTGSGLTMRYTDIAGNLLDVYQKPSDLVNEAGNFQNPANIDTQLDRALGAEGYYGAIGTHYDYSDTFDRQLTQSAKARNVPIVSVKQLMDWTDGRNASKFSTPSWSGNNLTFNTTVDGKAGSILKSMLPVKSAKGNLQSITKDGNNVNFTTDYRKGVMYAIFPASTGSFTATYAADITVPTIASSTPANNASDVEVIEKLKS